MSFTIIVVGEHFYPLVIIYFMILNYSGTGGSPLFEFLKNLFSRNSTHPSEDEPLLEPEFQTKQCRSCGRPISYNPEWKHIPNYCRECRKDYRAGLITRTCKRCGKTFTLPESVQHWPNYCQECKARFRPVETITRTCRGAGISLHSRRMSDTGRIIAGSARRTGRIA